MTGFVLGFATALGLVAAIARLRRGWPAQVADPPATVATLALPPGVCDSDAWWSLQGVVLGGEGLTHDETAWLDRAAEELRDGRRLSPRGWERLRQIRRDRL